jgi:hypothetical protein
MSSCRLRPLRPELDGQDPFQICGGLCQTRKTLTSLYIAMYGTHHSHVLVAHALRVADNKKLKLDLPAKRH